MKYQRGVTLTGVLLGGAVLGVLALLAMRVTPPLIEYKNVVRAVNNTATDPSLKGSSVAQIREAFAKRAEIDDIKSLQAADLDITKDGNDLVIAYSYVNKVPLFKNVSLVFDFEGSSKQ